MNKFYGLLLMAGVLGFSSCDKNDEPAGDEPSDGKTGEIVLSGTELYSDDWVYFSFETVAEVDGLDSTNFNSSQAWDIAFHSRLGRTNGGNSGIGLGAVYDTEMTDFDAVKTVDTSKFIIDTTVNLIVGIGARGPVYKSVPGNDTFDSAFDVDGSQHPPVYTPLNRVYVVKTASGKYAKIQITGYFDDYGESGHINFKYAYQDNGGTSFN